MDKSLLQGSRENKGHISQGHSSKGRGHRGEQVSTEEAGCSGRKAKKKSSRKGERGNPAVSRKSCGISSQAWRGKPMAQPALFHPSAPPCRVEAGGDLVRNHTHLVVFSTSASCTGEGPGASPKPAMPVSAVGSGP